MIFKNGKFVKASKWQLFKQKIYNKFHRFKIVDTKKYTLIPYDDLKYYFKLSKKEYNEAREISSEKGSISYEFHPCGIGWGVSVRILDTGEIIDITDVNSW